MDTAGIPTTYGAEPFRDRVPATDAIAVDRLHRAGAVLVAKLSLGALALNDVWFGGETKNPWVLEEGSSGSSAGPGAATAAGCVGFSLGSETGGSIVSPSMRCGITGLRPTYGRVPRTGAQVDLLLVPSLQSDMLVITNCTGHPSLTLRTGFVEIERARSDWAPNLARPLPMFAPKRRVPHGVTLIGRLFDEGTIGRVGIALERASGVANERPPGY